MSREPTPALSLLRAHTNELHRALERTPCMTRLAADDATPADVARALTVLHAGFVRVEAGLREETWYRPQAPALAADLALLPAFTAPQVTDAPGPASLPNHAARLGAAYVLVGSRLGARTIARNLRSQWGAAFIAASSYYGAEASHASEQWQTLMGQLAALDDAETAAAVATDTFRLLMTLSEAAAPQ